jgi:ribonuclease BN (tRNA processing enzyme)
MKITFLGTNGWYDTPTGSTLSAVVDAGSFAIVMDAGFGLYKLRGLPAKNKRIYLFISHLHLDHICGLHTLPLFKFKSLDIFCQKGMKKHLEYFLNHPFTVSPKQLPYPVRITEIIPGKYKKPIPFECLPLKHADPCLGYRFSFGKKIVTYCCDTGICKNDELLARDADMLIHECAFLPGITSNWGHTNPEEAAALAKRANAKKLVLTHFAADTYRSGAIKKRSQGIAKKIFPATIMASDGLTLNI